MDKDMYAVTLRSGEISHYHPRAVIYKLYKNRGVDYELGRNKHP